MSAYSVADISSADPFEYTPLTGQQIRLLRLQSGAYDDPISCTLEITNLAHEIDSFGSSSRGPGLYDTISYVWGDPRDTHLITCEFRL
jgi:hypothetical protein